MILGDFPCAVPVSQDGRGDPVSLDHAAVLKGDPVSIGFMPERYMTDNADIHRRIGESELGDLAQFGAEMMLHVLREGAFSFAVLEHHGIVCEQRSHGSLVSCDQGVSVYDERGFRTLLKRVLSLAVCVACRMISVIGVLCVCRNGHCSEC